MDGFKKMMGWLPVNPEYRTEWKLGPEEVARGPGSETNENRPFSILRERERETRSSKDSGILGG